MRKTYWFHLCVVVFVIAAWSGFALGDSTWQASLSCPTFSSSVNNQSCGQAFFPSNSGDVATASGMVGGLSISESIGGGGSTSSGLNWSFSAATSEVTAVYPIGSGGPIPSWDWLGDVLGGHGYAGQFGPGGVLTVYEDNSGLFGGGSSSDPVFMTATFTDAQGQNVTTGGTNYFFFDSNFDVTSVDPTYFGGLACPPAPAICGTGSLSMNGNSNLQSSMIFNFTLPPDPPPDPAPEPSSWVLTLLGAAFAAAILRKRLALRAVHRPL